MTYTGKTNKNGQRHGHGTMMYSNGDTYTGEWESGKQNGHGTFTGTDGSKYIGGWKDGLCHGQATHTLANGHTVTGEWKHGLLPRSLAARIASPLLGRLSRVIVGRYREE